MATPTADSYSAASGASIFGGRFSVPAWVPPVGYFADVPMANNPVDVKPAIYNPGDVGTAFTHWGGSAILLDYSPLGAQVYYSAGHETAGGQANIQMSLVCDFSTLTWAARNVPVAANASSIFVNGYAPDGTPYNPHTYLGLQELPAAWGGGSKGTLASFFFAGSGVPNKINLLDVSQPTNGYTVLATNQPQNVDPSKISFTVNGTGGSYPITVMDRSRGGWWAATNAAVDYMLFISKDGTITQYPALGGNSQGGSLVLCNSLNLLIGLDGGYSSGTFVGTSYRRLYIRNLTTGVVTSSQTLGTVPGMSFGYDGSPTPNFHTPDKLGLQWVDELGCIIGLDTDTTPPTVVQLTPPTTNPDTNQWSWSTVPVQHSPSDSGGQSALQMTTNSAWSKFRYVPTLKAFVYGSALDRKPQVIKV